MTEFPSGKRLIVYHTNWSTYDRNYQVKDIPVDCMTDVNYAFFKLAPNESGFYVPCSTDPWSDFDKPFEDNGSSSKGNLRQFQSLKSSHRFSLGMSIGGWTHSKHFSDAVASQQSRDAFIQAVFQLLRTHTVFDVVDFDWEHISPANCNFGDPGNVCRPNDGLNFGLLLQQLRHSLDVSQDLRHIRLTACVTGDHNAMDALPAATMAQTLASVNVMTYDYACGAETTVHSSNILPGRFCRNAVDLAVRKLLSVGVPANKIVIGAALYSRGFSQTNGLGHPHAGVSPDKSWEDGVCDYKTLPRQGATEFWDDESKASFSFDPVKRIFNSYDTAQSVREKCRYVWEMGLQGIIVWESSGDFPVHSNRSLIRALYEGLSKYNQ